MAQIDRHFITPLFILMTVAALSMLPYEQHAQASEGAFTVEDINVDVTAENAAKAREEAFAKAQYRAFKQLTNRLLSKAQAETFVMPDVPTISTFIQDFEVTNEQLSTVRYVGTYTFRFKDEDVRRFLNMQNVSFTDVSSKPILVLPFYQTGASTILWGDNNLWLDAWSRHKTYQGLVPTMVPMGDLQDVNTLEESRPLTYDSEKIQAMVERYGAREALIVIASPKDAETLDDGTLVPGSLEISIYQALGMTPRFLRSITVRKTPEDSNAEAIFDKGVQRVRDVFLEQWKSQTVVNPSFSGNSLKARVRFSSMQEWIETQSALERVQGVTDMKLLSLTPRMAELEINFKGSESRLRLALSQADMTLSKPQENFSNPQFQNNGIDMVFYDLYLDKYGMRR